MTAGLATSEQWNTADLPIAEKARHLAQFAEAWLGMEFISWNYTKAHSGQPWNELANTVANWFSGNAKHSVPTPALPKQFPLGTLDISRLHMLAPGVDSLAMPRLHGGVGNWSQTPMQLTVLRPEQVTRIYETQLPTSWSFDVRAVSVNVQSAIGRMQYYEQQLLADSVGIAFMQETKLPAGRVDTRHFYRFHSEHERHWGTAVWIAKDGPVGFAGKDPAMPDVDSFAVLAQGPRQIFVSFSANGCQICVASLHFPHQSRPQNEIDAFHQLVENIWMKWKDVFFIVGADGNARVPEWHGHATGGRKFGQEDANGVRLANLVDHMRAWAPSTFEHVHKGEDATFTHCSGTKSRIDFFFLPQGIPSSCFHTWVNDDFDTVSENDDHAALCLDMQVALISKAVCDHKCCARKYDVRMLKIPEVRAAVAAKLDALPIVSWDVDVSQHAQCLQDRIQGILLQEVPGKPSRPFQPHFRRSLGA